MKGTLKRDAGQEHLCPWVESKGTRLRSDHAGGLGNDVGSFLGDGDLCGTLEVTYAWVLAHRAAGASSEIWAVGA